MIIENFKVGESMKLYLATSSLNFNDIFATESISPKAFYAQRGFGTRRHFTTSLSLGENVTTWYTFFPTDEHDFRNGSEYEEYPLIIEHEFEPMDEDLVKYSEFVYLSYKTVYFTRHKTSFYFLSQDDMEKVVAKSKTVEETKLVDVYRGRFHVVPQERLTSVNMMDILSAVDRIGNPQPTIALAQDRLFNSIKGFVFAFISDRYSSSRQMVISEAQMMTELKSTILRSMELCSKIEFGCGGMVTGMLRLIYKQLGEGKPQEILPDYTIPIIQLKGHKARLAGDFDSNQEELRAFEITLNTVLQNPKSSVGEISKQEVQLLIQTVGQNISTVFREKSAYSSDIENIKDKILNRAFEVDITDIKTDVMKNLLAFVMKFNKPDELRRFVQIKSIPKSHMAFSFLGSFVGFSGLSRTLTSELISEQAGMGYTNLENELTRIRHQISLLTERDFAEVANRRIRAISNTETNGEVSRNNTPYIRGLFEMPSELNGIEDELFTEIQRIRKPSFVTSYLNQTAPIPLESGAEVTFRPSMDGVNVEIRDKSDTFLVTLKHKDMVSDSERKVFKTRLKEGGLSSSVCQGQYPVFSYSFSKEGMPAAPDDDALKRLLVNLTLIR